MPAESPRDIFVRQLASREPRSENDIQSDLYGLLTVGGLNLSAEQVAKTEVGTGDGTRRRIDVAVGHVSIEVKKDLRTPGILSEAEEQLAGYVTNRQELTGSDCAGILTDGTTWLLYHLDGDVLGLVAGLELNAAAPDVDSLINWLEAVLATQVQVRPTPREIATRLGATSPAHLYDHAALTALYFSASAMPEVGLKRELWAKLLRTAFGSGFDDSDRLFIDHALLVLSAEVIAHAALGFDVSATGGMSPRQMAMGTAFANSQIFGVVQQDFFDWVLDVEGGEQFVSSLAKRIAQFDWTSVEHDVLKVLYESVIDATERRRLGEYYTPDWLADRMVHEQVEAPLEQKVLDPSCGSGTFLFHAVRLHLEAATQAGLSTSDGVQSAVQHVFGLDIHPVAVTFARVTYLLAIGADRLNDSARGPISIPVYLGDALQWEQRIDIFAHEDNVTVSTEGTDLATGVETTLFEDDLIFPRSVVTDADTFDRLVGALADKAADHSDRNSRSIIMPTLRQFGVHEDDVDVMVATFDTLRTLHANGRDHIWGYYVRNLIRPIWLAEPANKVDVLVGNPPWLAYSKMSAAMQRRFTTMSRERGLLSGNQGVSGRDLSTLFVVRATELYLKQEGKLAFVMPHGTLTRQPHAPFRSGQWDGPTQLHVRFETSWDLSSAATGFPNHACVVRASVAAMALSMSAEVQKWTTTGSQSDVSWQQMESRLTVTNDVISVTAEDDGGSWSPYRARFRQGAILAPRVLLFMNEVAAGPLGSGAGRIAITSRRSNQEDVRWRDVRSLTGVVERAFFKSIALGETTLPFRQIAPLHAVLPVKPDSTGLMTSAQIEEHPALAEWWRAAEMSFATNKTGSADETLLSRVNFHNQLSAQLPTASHRVVYTKAGNTLSASRIEDPNILIDHKLYWAACSTVDEARYLAAILNSNALLVRVQPFQAVGLFGPRDFDKNVFRAQIQPYDASNHWHYKLAVLGGQAERAAAEVDVSAASTFQRARRLVRQRLHDYGIDTEIEEAVLRAVPEA